MEEIKDINITFSSTVVHKLVTDLLVLEYEIPTLPIPAPMPTIKDEYIALLDGVPIKIRSMHIDLTKLCTTPSPMTFGLCTQCNLVGCTYKHAPFCSIECYYKHRYS